MKKITLGKKKTTVTEDPEVEAAGVELNEGLAEMAAETKKPKLTFGKKASVPAAAIGADAPGKLKAAVLKPKAPKTVTVEELDEDTVASVEEEIAAVEAALPAKKIGAAPVAASKVGDDKLLKEFGKLTQTVLKLSEELNELKIMMAETQENLSDVGGRMIRVEDKMGHFVLDEDGSILLKKIPKIISDEVEEALSSVEVALEYQDMINFVDQLNAGYPDSGFTMKHLQMLAQASGQLDNNGLIIPR